MGFANVPGTGGKYRADSAGFAAIGKSQALGDIAMNAAWRGAALGRQYDPKGAYTAEPRVVRGGWNHEPRAAAAVVQSKPGPKAIDRLVMADVLIGMESRSGSSRIS